MRGLFIICILIIISNSLISQHLDEEEKYVPEDDSMVLDNLESWQDKKFGLLMHWGAYSQWGIVESWSLCPEDYGWCERKKGDHPEDYFAYKKEYENLKNTFNPINFDPDRWARAAANAGIKYMVFTTKHHDGFCMFDSKFTNYKITYKTCPFSQHPQSNITKHLFDAFREHDMWVGAYFSKPDWHNPDYWDPYFPPRDRNVNYDPVLYPEKWEKFVQFTHNQILELMTDYGDVKILWLDGGWVKKRDDKQIDQGYKNKLKEGNAGFIKHSVISQDIKMDELVVKAREKQPGLIVVDRAVHGKNQNYLTPENRVPEVALPYPWESCIISGGGWSYTPNATYMKHREAIHLLVDIVAKGGNLLLNIAPGPDGQWQQGAYDLLKAYGHWMKVNDEAIYNTRSIAPYKERNICFTQNESGDVYLIYLAEEGEDVMPEEVEITTLSTPSQPSVSLLGSKTKLKWEKTSKGWKIVIPEKIRHQPPSDYAWAFRIK